MVRVSQVVAQEPYISHRFLIRFLDKLEVDKESTSGPSWFSRPELNEDSYSMKLLHVSRHDTSTYVMKLNAIYKI